MVSFKYHSVPKCCCLQVSHSYIQSIVSEPTDYIFAADFDAVEKRLKRMTDWACTQPGTFQEAIS